MTRRTITVTDVREQRRQIANREARLEARRREHAEALESEAAPAARFRVIVAEMDGASPEQAERFAKLIGEIVGGRV